MFFPLSEARRVINKFFFHIPMDRSGMEGSPFDRIFE